MNSLLVKGVSCKDKHHDDHHGSLSPPNGRAPIDDHASIPADLTLSIHYYILGLQIEHERSNALSSLASSSSTPADEYPEDAIPSTSGIDNLNHEVLSDLATGLCNLYRHGRIRPQKSEVPASPSTSLSSLTSNGSRKGKEKAEEPARSTWEQGGDAALQLAYKLEQLLGIRHAQSPTFSTLPDDASDGQCGSPTPLSPTSNGSSPNGRGLKKSVSFSILPPKHRLSAAVSTLDTITTRHARSAIIHLYYILALVSFAATSASDRSHVPDNITPHSAREVLLQPAKVYWEHIISLGTESPGAGSREADELVVKARSRLEMLKEEEKAVREALRLEAERQQSEHTQQAESDLAEKMDQLRKAADPYQLPSGLPKGILKLKDLLSPTGEACEQQAFFGDLAAPALVEEEETAGGEAKDGPVVGKVETSNGHDKSEWSDGTPKKSRSRSGSLVAGLSHILAPLDMSRLQPSKTTEHSASSESVIEQAGAATAKKDVKPAGRAKFAIHDSPTSTIRSYFSGVTGRNRGNSNASAVSYTSELSQNGGLGGNKEQMLLSPDTLDEGTQKKGRRAPWALRRPSSSTSLSTSTPEFQRATSTAPRFGSTQRTGSFSSFMTGESQRFAKPTLSTTSRTSSRGWAPRTAFSSPLASVTDSHSHDLSSSQSATRQQHLRRNDTSVASLPHYRQSANGSHSSHPTRNQSAAHLLLNHGHGQNGDGARKRSNSSASLLFSAQRGVQRSFSSLRNFFTASPYPDPDEVDEASDNSDEDESDPEAQPTATASVPKSNGIVGVAPGVALAKLRGIAEQHDSRVAELEAQKEFGDGGYYWVDADEAHLHESSVEVSPEPAADFIEQMDQRANGVGLSVSPSTASPAAEQTQAKPISPPIPAVEFQPATLGTSLSRSIPVRPLPRTMASSRLSIPRFENSKGKRSRERTTSSNATVRQGTSGNGADDVPPLSPIRQSGTRPPPGTPMAHRRPSKAKLAERSIATAMPTFSHTLYPSKTSSGESTPLAQPFEYNDLTRRSSASASDEGDQRARPVAIDPLLAALEAASRVNVKSRCAVCGQTGVNFPKCARCGMTFCSRECRTSTGTGANEGRHVCLTGE